MLVAWGEDGRMGSWDERCGMLGEVQGGTMLWSWQINRDASDAEVPMGCSGPCRAGTDQHQRCQVLAW